MEYTSFAIAVIESIWPNPDGSDYYGAGGSENASKAGYGDDSSPIYGQKTSSVGGNVRNQDPTDAESEGGWYKIIPLNIVNLKTSSSTSDFNNWSITFTADDMIVVGKEAFEGTSLISDILDSLAENEGSKDGTLLSLDKILSGSVLSKDPYVHRRVSLKDGVFNIQDIAESGDTVTIWYYCDPSEFFPIEDAASRLKTTNNIEIDFKEVIGSGDRKVQFKVGDNAETMSSTINSPNYLYPYLINSALDPKNSGLDVNTSQVDALALDAGFAGLGLSEIDGVNVKNVLGNTIASLSATDRSKTLSNSNIDALVVYLQRTFPDDFGGVIDFNTTGENPHVTYKNLTPAQAEIIMYLTNNYRFQGELTGSSDDKVRQLEGSIKGKIPKPETYNGSEKDKEALKKRPASIATHIPFSANSYLAGRKGFVGMLTNKINSSAKVLSATSADSVKLVNPRGKIRRKLLVSQSFGENCYTIMKGHIVGINTSIAPGDRRITLTGAGYEHPLNKHMIFFDSLLNMFGAAGFFQDYTQSLVNMSPSAQMMWILTRFVPKQMRWGEQTATSSADKAWSGFQVLRDTSVKHSLSQAPEVMNRGSLVIDLVDSINASIELSKKEEFDAKVSIPQAIIPYSRVFTPLTYYNMYRLGESIRAYEKADPTGQLGNTSAPMQVEDRTTIMNMIKQIAGAGTIMEFFVDNVGQLIYRVSAEAWERTPRPEFTPTVDELNTLSFTSSENDENIVTIQDVVMQAFNAGGGTSTAIGKYATGRGLARTGGIPIKSSPAYTKMNDLRAQLPPSMFRYGLRYQVTNDVFGATVNVARDKAHTIHRFYGQPVSRASVSVIADSSYRIGDTVYVCLPSHKKRMKTRRSISWLTSWLGAIKGDDTHLKMYVGREGRFDHPEYYENTGFVSQKELGIRPYSHEEIADKFLKTLSWMQNVLGGDKTLTWDNFPTTLWWYLENPNAENSKEIREVYRRLLRTAVLGVALDTKLPGGKNLHDFLRYVRFNNFISMSYYIDGVSHTYEYSTKAVTDLELSYGQENICLMHPKGGFPVGFFSVERKIKDLDTVDKFENYEIPADSVWRKLMVEQFKEDDAFKNGSFIYRSSAVRNTGNYLHKIAHEYGEVFSEGYYT